MNRLSTKSLGTKDQKVLNEMIEKYKRKKKENHGMVNKLFLILCCIGCVCHISYITLDYLSYRTVISTKILYRDNINVPSFSFCFQHHDPNEPEKMTIYEYMTRFQDEWKLVVNNITDADRRVLYKIDEKTKYEKERLIPFYLKTYICLKILPVYSNLSSNFVIDSDRGLLEIFFNRTNLMKVQGEVHLKFIIHGFNILPHLGETKPLEYDEGIRIDNTSLGDKFLYYDYIETKYLDGPYDPPCVHYSDDGIPFESRGHCVETCLYKKFTEKYSNSYYFITTSTYPNETMEGEYSDKEFREYCNSECVEDCNSEKYFLRTKTTLYSDDPALVLYADSVETILTYTPVFDLVSYIIFVSGVIGIWLGLNLYQGITKMIKNVNKYIVKKF